MNAKQIAEAMKLEDGAKLAGLIAALRGAGDDEMMNLLEGIKEAVKIETRKDIIIDLEDAEETEAAAFIKENYGL